MARGDRLERFKYISYPRAYAREFGQDFEQVFKSVSFETITQLWIATKEEGEFSDRYHEAEKLTQPTPQVK